MGDQGDPKQFYSVQITDKFHWKPKEEAEQAFQNLKTMLSNTTVLVLLLPNFSKAFVIETGACYTGIWAVFMQEGKPLAFLSKTLSPRHLELSTYEKELLAISMAVQKWRTYLLGQRFVIKTDHEALKYLWSKN